MTVMHSDDEHQAFVDRKRSARMAAIDVMTPELRALVHEYGLNVVKSMVDIGVTKPNHIRHIVRTVLDELSPISGTFSAQGVRTPIKVRP